MERAAKSFPLFAEPSPADAAINWEDTKATAADSDQVNIEAKQHALLESLLNSKGKQVAVALPSTSSDPSSGPSSSTPATVRDPTATPVTNGGGPSVTPAKEEHISRRTLVKWKRLDLAEEEAKKRGGWGKLTYEEFEQIYKNEESKGSRLDYLGTWIDFCIPFH